MVVFAPESQVAVYPMVLQGNIARLGDIPL